MNVQTIFRLGGGLLVLVLAGCSVKNQLTPPTRTVNEQLLLDQSLEQSLANASLPIPPGKSVGVEVVGLTADKDFVQAGVISWLAHQGFRVPADKQEDYLLRVRLHAFGTNVNDRFVGIPPVTGSLFPIALPELALYKHQDQAAVTRFKMEIYERASGRLLLSTPTYEGYTYLRDATMLFAFSRSSSNLSSPPP